MTTSDPIVDCRTDAAAGGHSPASRGSASVDLQAYIMRADKTQAVVLQEQWAQATEYGSIYCAGCGLRRHLTLAYRCLYCGIWYCAGCAEAHFGQTVQEWVDKKRAERRSEMGDSVESARAAIAARAEQRRMQNEKGQR